MVPHLNFIELSFVCEPNTDVQEATQG